MIIRKQQKKKICRLVDFTISAGYRVEIKESEKARKILGPCQGTKKLWNIQVMVILTVVGAPETVLRRLIRQGRGTLRNQRKKRVYSDYSFVGINQNTQEGFECLRRFTVP